MIYTITIAEPWNFESSDGKNIIRGVILSIVNSHLAIFKANNKLHFDDVEGDILILSPRTKEKNFDNMTNEEVNVSGGLFIDNYHEGIYENILINMCKFVLIGSIKKE